MHHHGTAAWILITSAVFLGCASSSFGPASLFFFSPYFVTNTDTSTNTSYTLLYCDSNSLNTINSELKKNNTDTAFDLLGLGYLECAYMWSTVSTGLLHFFGALVMGYGGVYVFGLSNKNDDNANDASSDNSNNNRSSSLGVGQADETEGGGSRLPGERYFKIFYVSVLSACFFGLISGVLLLPDVSGRKVKISSVTNKTEVTDARGDLLWGSLICALLGSCSIGASMLSLMSGVSIRWPNLYDVLFEGAGRDVHSCKPRKVNRVKEKQDFLLGIEATTVRSQNTGRSPGNATGRYNSFLEVNEEDTIDYLHMALTTPPTIIFAAYISGWAASFFFANVALLSIAGQTQTRSAFYAFILLFACPVVSYFLCKMAECCSVDHFESIGKDASDENENSNNNNNNTRLNNNNESQASLGSQQQQQQENTKPTPISPHALASLGGGSRLNANNINNNNNAQTDLQSIQADGIGWANNDFAPDFFRSTIMTVTYALGEVLGEPGSRFRYDCEADQLPRRLALRVVRSLRIMGTFLTFLMLPLLLTAVIGSQVRLTAFAITTQPPIGNHIYDRLNILTSQVPMMIVWWLILYLLTKAVFLRSGVLKYIAVGFGMCIKAAFVLFPLQIVYNNNHNEGGPDNLIPNPKGGTKEVVPQLVAFLPQFFAAAATTQLNIFTIGLAFCTLPRPLFPLAISALAACWGIGEFTSIRTSPLTPNTSFGFPLIVALFLSTIIILALFFLIVKWKNGFANPRTLIARFKEEAVEEEDQRQRMMEQEYNNNRDNNPRYGSMDVSQQQNNNIDGNNTDQAYSTAVNVTRNVSVLSNRTRGSYGNYDVLPPHRLLHWSPSEIDAAFSVFDSTESAYIKRPKDDNQPGNNNNNAAYGGYNNNHGAPPHHQSSLLAHHASSGLGGGGSSNTPNSSGSPQQTPNANSSSNRPPLPPPVAPRLNSNLGPSSGANTGRAESNLESGLPRRLKTTPRSGGSELKYYAARRNSSRN